MAIESFIPLKGAKITTEKAVKQKPTLAELTKIEVPGRKMPPKSPPSKRKNFRGKPAKVKAEPESIRQPKRDVILIITEKPQAAQKIASALGTPKKFTEGSASYFEVEKEGEKIVVASAVGHLFGLTYVQGQKGWPIFDLEWRPSYEKDAASAFTKRYYDLLKKLSRRAKDVIVATDYDIEGEVIGWNVLRFICKLTTAKRMKYSTLTKPELIKSYENPMKELDWGQAYAGETRHILDWLYGINLSRALMAAVKTTGSFKLLSIGRVQGPALKIIVDREREIKAFIPEPYWQVFASVQGTEYKYPEDIFDKSLLDKFKDIKEGNAETKETEEKISPPHPFDLTTLQREAYRYYKMSPSKTLAIAQKLYLEGLISYPRTSSQKVPDSIEPKKILKALEKAFPLAKGVSRSHPVEGKKEDPAHPSIFPTGELANHKNPDEKKLYELIVNRFIALFYHDAVTANRRTVITAIKNPDITFRATGLKVLDPAWTKVYPAKLEEVDLPILNGLVKIDSINIEEKETQPPKRFTPASLITILEKKNLGTKATRSMIVDTLFDRGYLDGTSIQATELGLKLIETLEKFSPIIIDENLTRTIEEEMDTMLTTTSLDHEKLEKQIIDKSKRLITDLSKEFKMHEIEIGKGILKGIVTMRETQKENNTLRECPTCKKGMLRIMYSPKIKRSFIGCSSYPECKQTYTLPPNALIKKSEKQCPECGFPKLLAIRRGKRPWEFCFNSACPIVIKQIEDWRAKKQNAENSQDQ